jgi:aspartyl-tRNA(Asn)/glutamyl-tRNA(Gln) amidotransferase subunit A
VTDTAIVYGALTRSEPVTAADAAVLRGLRFGVPHDLLRDGVEPEIRGCFDRACERLSVAGAAVLSIELQAFDLASAAYLAIVLPEAAEGHAVRLNRHPDRYSSGVRIRLEAGRYVLAEDYVRAQTVREQLTDSIDTSFDLCDAIALPALAIKPQAIGATNVVVGGRREPVRAAMLRLTQPFNMSGHPAISIPCGKTSDGWPCGFQLVGRGRDTRALLRLALACEPHLAGGGEG